MALPYCYVYRLYDVDHRLLYVGCSESPDLRQRALRLAKPWYVEVRSIELSERMSRKEGLIEERRLIVAEKPKYNIYKTKPAKEPDTYIGKLMAWNRRNREILARHKAGQSCAAIAKSFGISRQRVHKLVNRAAA